MFHLSLAIYTVTIIIFEAKGRYVHWTSESTHYGHHLRLVVIIQSRAHHTTLYFLMTWLVDQLNAPHGTSSVASHYLTTIMPTCRLVSTLHLHSYKIHKIHSYKKQSVFYVFVWVVYLVREKDERGKALFANVERCVGTFLQNCHSFYPIHQI